MDIVQSTIASRPSFFASPNHGRVKFDGTQQFMQMGSAASDWTYVNGAGAGCTTFTVLGLGTLTAIASGTAVVWDNHDNGTVSPGAGLAFNNAGNILFQTSGAASVIVNVASAATFSSGAKVCVITRVQPAGYSVSINGVESTGVPSAAPSALAPVFPMILGRRGDPGGLLPFYNNGFVLEMGFYDEYISSEDVSQLRLYSQNKYGVG